MNCDRIAPFYRWIERAAFGGALQRHRLAYLKAAGGKKRALVLGDGDGRFCQVLASAYADLHVDCVEISSGMLSQARTRLGFNDRVKLIHGDAFRLDFSSDTYDLVYTHFFLDCFTTENVSVLVSRLLPALTVGAGWIVSDFRQIEHGWRKIYARVWLAAMYTFFRLSTGLETKHLPDYRPALLAAGFKLHTEQASFTGLIASEFWQR